MTPGLELSKTQGPSTPEEVEYMKKIVKYKDKKHKRDRLLPTISKYPPQRNIGSTSELFADKVEEYIQKNPHGLLKEKDGDTARFKRRRAPLSRKNFRLLTSVKYMRSLVEPGEAVGLLASQG